MEPGIPSILSNPNCSSIPAKLGWRHHHHRWNMAILEVDQYLRSQTAAPSGGILGGVVCERGIGSSMKV